MGESHNELDHCLATRRARVFMRGLRTQKLFPPGAAGLEPAHAIRPYHKIGRLNVCNVPQSPELALSGPVDRAGLCLLTG